MRIEKRLFILFIFLLSCIPVHPLYFKHIGMQDGLSQPSVLSIHQDELGRMWFATLEGISMFDGIQTTAFKPSDNTDENIIGNRNYSLTGDNEGNLYFLSDNSLLMYDLRSQKFARIIRANAFGVGSYNGSVWAGVNDTVYVLDKDKKPSYYADLAKQSSKIQEIFVDSENKLWIGTESGLFLQNKEGSFDVAIPSEDIYTIFEDSRNTLWVSTRYNGMYKKERNGDFVYYEHDPENPNGISSKQIRCFVEDNYGNIWIGTFKGLYKYNPTTKQYTLYAKDELPGSLTHSSVYSLYKDKQGSIWVGTYYGGVSYFNPEKDIFTLYPANQLRDDCISFPFVGHMVEDNDNNVWICTEGGGLNFFDRKTRKFTHYFADGSTNSIPHNNIKSICYDSQRNELYLGTHTGGLSIFNIAKKQFRNIFFENKAYQEMAGNIVNHVRIYKDKYLILLTQKGLFKYDLDTEDFSPLIDRYIPISSNFTIDSDDFLWIPSSAQVTKIDLNGEVEDEIYHYKEKGLGKFNATTVFEDREGRLFFGTSGSGLYLFNKKEKIFQKILVGNNALQTGFYYNIAQSQQGYLIASSDKGIILIHPDLEKCNVVELGTALPLSGINQECGLLACRNGEIFAGGISGAVSFYEQDIFSPAKEYRLYFSALHINNELINPSDKDGVLKETLPYTRQIRLKHNQNNLILTFASNNYINMLTKTTYEYKLEGFDAKWITANSKDISYTNLNPGNYTLIVQEREPDLFQMPKIIRLGIVIKPPLYATPLAYFLYCLFIISVMAVIYHFKKKRSLLQASLELERKEKEKIEEINNAKLQFFSNISHEFRTPLTLIISQLDILLSASLAPLVYNKLLKVYKNTYHLRNLINELLDFRKLEQGHVKLKVYEQDIIPFLKEIWLSFYEYASNASITYNFQAPEGELKCWFDPKQMKKVFFNLLSNAFKYSKENATIEAVIEGDENEIRIKIIDNGIGIEKVHIDKIFDRFYQVDNKVENSMNFPSTGIGLSLTKNIVEMHHGMIRVESTFGYGSIFIVHLLKGQEHFSEEERVTVQQDYAALQAQDEGFAAMSGEEHAEEMPDALPDSEHITYKALLVEDNEELLETLNTLFSTTYKVKLARNGKEGLELAKKERPDIIVSDVMMPEMSGIEMCIKIKNDFDISHIPVVLLTALTSIEQNVEGLQRGADDYINKPFNAKVLLARCNNLVRNRIILQKKFSQQKDFDSQALASNPIDQKFLDTVNNIIEKNIGNEMFDMNVLAKELALSRSSLYAKFKALTGITPNDYVLNCKLKKAVSMLTDSPEIAIADISERLGFGSPRYFTRCFKAQYNVSPAEYRKKKDK